MSCASVTICLIMQIRSPVFHASIREHVRLLVPGRMLPGITLKFWMNCDACLLISTYSLILEISLEAGELLWQSIGYYKTFMFSKDKHWLHFLLSYIDAKSQTLYRKLAAQTDNLLDSWLLIYLRVTNREKLWSSFTCSLKNMQLFDTKDTTVRY